MTRPVAGRAAICGARRHRAHEAFDAGGLAEDLRGRERPAAADSQQRRSEPRDEGADLLLELVDLGGERMAAIDELAARSFDKSDPIDARGLVVWIPEVLGKGPAIFGGIVEETWCARWPELWLKVVACRESWRVSA
jgi:hypothetical protein